jgi:hypothetical protein
MDMATAPSSLFDSLCIAAHSVAVHVRRRWKKWAVASKARKVVQFRSRRAGRSRLLFVCSL